MKKRIFTLATLLIFMTGIMMVSCSKSNGWEAVVKKENSVTTVINPKDSKYGELDLGLEEDMSIGNEEDENYQFYGAAGILLDSEENILVLDAGNCRVQKFSKNGEYLQTIGSKGQGPGEFLGPSSFYIDGQNNLYVSEQMKIQVFDRAGEYQKSIPLDTRIYGFFIDPQGDIITYTIINRDEGSKKEIIKLDAGGKTKETIAEFSDVEAIHPNVEGGGTLTFKAYHQYNYWPSLYPAWSGGFIYAYSSEYKIFGMNSGGELQLVIQKDVSPNTISQEEKNFILKGIDRQAERRGIKLTKENLEAACQFPSHRPFFNRILVDDEGRIYVRNAESVLEQSGKAHLDVFNRDGYYLYKLILDFTPDLIQGRCIYDISTSEDTGEVQIKRFRIRNWDRMEN
jgi:hypothetical protein